MAKLALTEDQRDGLQEVANVAVGRTADKLARRFATFVQLPVPKVHLLDAADVSMLLATFDGSELITATTQPFFGTGVAGEALLLVTDARIDDLSLLMGYPACRNEGEQLERLLEMTSLLTGSIVHGLLEQLDIEVLVGHPALLARHAMRSEMLSDRDFPWAQALAVDLNYGFDGHTVRCDLVLLFHESAVGSLLHKIDLLLC